MIRGTTPTHTFVLPFSTELVKTLEITYAQCGKVILKKGTANADMSGNTVRIRLTQEDTLKFDAKTYVDIQVRVLTHEGDALASRVLRVRADVCLSDEVLT